MNATTNRPAEREGLFSSLLFSSLLLIFTLVGTSCEKDLELQKEELTPTVTLTDVAHFKSQARFEDAMAALRNEGTLPKEIHGITTLSQAVSLKSESLEESPLDTLIYSDLLKSVLNQNYEIAIGDVFVRITQYGTLLTDITQYQLLREMPVDSDIFQYCQPTTSALGYSSENGLYKVTSHNNLYLFDSFREGERELEPICEVGGGGPPVIITPPPSPTAGSWLDITCERTDLGELWDELLGFSVSARHYFDDDNRVDVKFYAQNFLFYSEMGIKTKTQTRGWTGFWRKRYADEIINGWEVLNFSEEWPEPVNRFIEPPEFTNYTPMFHFGRYRGTGVWDETQLADQIWRTFNIFGINLEITNRQKLESLWNAVKWVARTTVTIYNNRFVSPQNNKESLRILPPLHGWALTSYHSIISLGPYERRHANTRKETLIIDRGSGGQFHANIGLGNFAIDFIEMPDFLTVEYTFLPNSVMYGAARIGNTWKGVRITIK